MANNRKITSTTRAETTTRESKGVEETQTFTQSQALLAAILQTAEDAIIVLDPDLNVTIFNPAAEEMFRIPAAEVIGRRLDRFIPTHRVEWHNDQIRSFGQKLQSPHRMGLTHEITGVRSTGETFPIEVSISVLENQGKRYYTAIVRDITARKQIEEELRFLTIHDPLTRIYNRLHFEEELKRLQNSRIYPISIIFADVDGLKEVNDRFGHAQGDELIRSAARLLKASFRTEDVVARLGGDEFGVILPQADEDTTLEAIERIYAQLSAHNRSNPSLPELLSISLGYATTHKGQNLEHTLRLADRRMYQHKAGKAHRRTDRPA